LVAARDAMKISPDGVSYANVCHSYVLLNRLDEAKATATEAQARNVDAPYLYNDIYFIAFLQHDSAGMAQAAEVLASKPGYEDASLATQADTAAHFGRLAKARELTQRAVDSAVRTDGKERAGSDQAVAALREEFTGNTALAKRQAHAALALSNSRAAQEQAAIALALTGETAEAARLNEENSKRFPEDTWVQFGYAPLIRASILLTGDKTAQAIEALAPAARYELGGWGGSVNLVPVYVRGLAYLRLKQGPAAAAEFQKIIDRPGVVVNAFVGALARLGLGRS
jgi:eukaryotic-like serine/threonine-protein kinase